MKLGCIGDDFTGSSDLANTLAKAGMRTVQYVGVPEGPAASDVDAGVVALKSRSIPVADAVSLSLAALEWLKAQGCTQFLFKYCSTFDSTPHGNIGPVAEALADALDARQVVVCPAFPGTGRSVYQGHLFVGDTLLSESGMENHPLTPMTDPDIRRWLAPQSKSSVGHVAAADVLRGREAIDAALRREDAAGHRLVVVDAIDDDSLISIGKAAKGLKLITGGSGIAMGLPANFGCQPGDTHWQGQSGPALALSGSCSKATRAQVMHHRDARPAREISVEEVITQAVTPTMLIDWAQAQPGVPLIYSSADPEIVADAQERFGVEQASTALEGFFAELAKRAVDEGFTRIVTAGGETSGAVVQGLGLTTLGIGPEIDPGVPALRAGGSLAVALKSGNFGAVDFFEKAAGVLEANR
ncbi:MAG: 3-oxo-tetronate kinase [Cohaesibacteraceae bacterium]